MTEEKSVFITASKLLGKGSSSGQQEKKLSNRHDVTNALYRAQMYRKKEAQILRFNVSDVVSTHLA